MTTEPKRPWYLVLALLGALALGTEGAYSGWEQVALYHATLDPSVAGQGIADEHERSLVVSHVEAVIHALDAAKSRGWPLAVATLLVGGATLLFAMRALGGSSGARGALLQLVVAQAGVAVAGHFLMRDVREVVETELRLGEAQRAASTMVLVLRGLGSALVVIGLTRRGSREYFAASSATVEEQ